MNTKNQYLFVYGTLLAPFSRPEYLDLLEHAQDLGDAQTIGKLFNIGWYPGLVIDDQNSAKDNDQGIVLGRLWQPKSADDFTQLISKLDLYEGLSSDQAKPWQYQRQLISVSQGDDQFQAWCYLFNWSTEGLTHIESGNFIEFALTGMNDH